MSIVARPGSPVWNYVFELNGERYRGPTPFLLDFPSDDPVKRKKRGPNFKLAQDHEAGKRVEVRNQTAQSAGNSGAKVTIEVAFDEFYAAERKAIDRKIDGMNEHKAKRELHTLQTLKKNVDRMRDFFASVHKPPIKYASQITTEVMTALIEWRRDQPRWDREGQRRVSNATVNRTVTVVLREMFAWLERPKKVFFAQKPTWTDHWLKEPKERVRELEHDEEVALIEAFNPNYECWRQFALRSGMRLENTLLRWPEVNLRKMQVTVIGKGNKELIVPLTPEAAKIIKSRTGHHPEFVFTFEAKATYSYTHKTTGKRHDFVKGQRYPISYLGSQNYFKRARKNAAKQAPSLLSTDGRKTFRIHDQRHTFATRLLRDSKNLKLVSQALGHSTITTTAKYAHVMDSEVRDAMAAAEKATPLPIANEASPGIGHNSANTARRYAVVR